MAKNTSDFIDFLSFWPCLGEKMQIFVNINEQKLKAVLAENSSAKALYKELEKAISSDAKIRLSVRK